MCGITGFWNRNGAPADPGILDAMTASLVHRGPDDGGSFVDGPVALGHRRLSIIDVARGRQPMQLAGDPDLCIVYNGEVYNHAALRRELDRDPQAYRSDCDTETVLAAYRERGPRSVESLRGMFAFAVYDRSAGSLFLARDRMGIKPLYYYESPDLFAFASEIKALLRHPQIEARIDEGQLPTQLTLKYGLGEATLFRGIRKLAPACTLEIDRHSLRTHAYWEQRFEPKAPFASLDDAADEFRARFRESVELRLMSDVPLGVFLSGGIDSSAIAAQMSELVDEPIRSFSVAFAEPGYDEREHARAVAEHVGSLHREVLLDPDDWFRAWPSMLYHEDEPIAHPSSISLHFVSRLAAEDVKVVLTGEGADELMAGYERYYQTLANLRAGRFVPHALRRAARRILDPLPDSWFVKRKGRRTSLVLDADVPTLLLDNYAALTREDLRRLLRPELREGVDACYQPFEEAMTASGAEALLDRLLFADMKSYLLELLMKQDQMSMSASLESRVPFLDHELVEFVARLPVSAKLQGFETKRVLRRAVGSMLPPTIAKRPKMGFPTPTRDWFRSRFAPQLRELLLAPDARIHAWTEAAEVRRTLEDHQSGQRNAEEAVWTLANLELWARIFLDGQDPATLWDSLASAPARGSTA